MKRYKTFLVALVGIAIIYLANCSNQKSLQFEKEKIQYRIQVDSTLSKIDRKLAGLRAKYESPEEMKPDEIEEFATPEIKVDSVQQVIIRLEQIQENLNQKLGELEYVKEDQWTGLKKEIDLLLNEYRKL